MIRLFKYMKSYKKECILGPAFKLLEALFELFVPLVMATIIDYGISIGNKGYILKMSIVLAALGIVGFISSVTAQYFAAKAAVGFSAKVRHALFHHVEKMSYSDIDAIGTSTFITRITSDVNQVQTGVNLTLRLLLRSPFVVFGALIMASVIDMHQSLIFAGLIFILCIVVFGIMLITIPLHRRVQENLDEIVLKTRENLSGVRVLRAFCLEKKETDEFILKNGQLEKMQRFVGRVSALMNPITYVIINFAVIILLRVGALRVNSGIISSGEMVALYNYMSQILVELIKLATLIITITKSAACASRIQSVLQTEPDKVSGDKIKKPTIKEGSVRFENVCLKYKNGGDEVLTDISFNAKPGQTVGIIGGTGSGKTSVVNLIPAFYSATGGNVFVDGVDVKKTDINDLRSRIGIVPQKAVLFKGSIRENLLWGKSNASDEELMAALKTAQALDIVQNKDGGLDYELEQGGRNLSGGQRQRLTIARALVRKPKILILDDSASALDYATDASLRMAIRDMANAPTTFIVSQRTASVKYADMIIVLDDGRIVGKGTHEELLSSCDVYKEIYESQI